MRLVIAPDKFKGCLTAAQACGAIAAGWRRIRPDTEIDLCPMADGGEGTVAAMVGATGGRLVKRRVTGPLAEMKVDATFGFLGDARTAVIEMSAASGLALLTPQERNPRATTTFGCGELMAAAAEMGARRMILGIGGSATIDGGIGAAQACGLPVLLEGGERVWLSEPLTGGDLEKVILIKHGRGGKVDGVQIEVACDVDNPLCGPMGAAAAYGPQKGATPADVEWFDAQLGRLAARTGNQALAVEPGAGAAGGFGFGLAAFFGARLRRGIDIVIEATNLEGRLKDADLCITGEGRLDEQSLRGKAAIGVARLCKKRGVRCVALAGSIGPGAEGAIEEGITGYFPIGDGSLSLAQAMENAETLLAESAAKVAGMFNSCAGPFGR